MGSKVNCKYNRYIWSIINIFIQELPDCNFQRVDAFLVFLTQISFIYKKRSILLAFLYYQ